MAELLLSCQGLAKAFGAEPLFEGLAFGVAEGEHVGIVGPNGSGKTTLLRILAGLEAPDAGTRVARKRLRLAFVPQDPDLAPEATVASVLRAGLSDLSLDDHEGEARLAVAMGKAGLEDAAAPVASLSGGWRKRLVIARELAREPELLLLDEPMAGMNVEEKEDMCRFILDVNEEFGTTIALIEHDMGVVMDISDRIVVLDYGRKIADGPPEAIRNDQAVIDAYLGLSHDEPAERAPAPARERVAVGGGD